jgi:hypothetical protein
MVAGNIDADNVRFVEEDKPTHIYYRGTAAGDTFMGEYGVGGGYRFSFHRKTARDN